jgi:hypothetical protein
MVGNDKPELYASHDVISITFLLIGIIATVIFAFTLVLSQNHIAMAQQQPALEGTSFQSALVQSR